MAETKNCKQCQKQFTIEDDDLEFYKKISPTFDGKTFEIPVPTLCPTCREMNRLAWRNEISIYKRKSDKSSKEMISVYPADRKDYTIYRSDEWWADDWDALDFGFEFDFTKSFFGQYNQLLIKVPRVGLFNSQTEDSEYSNFAIGCKNCYMSSVIYYDSENTHYSYVAFTVRDSIDTSFCNNTDHSYACTTLNDCNRCFYSYRLTNCSDCWFSIDLIGCRDCLFCSNLRHKQFCIQNKQLTKEEFQAELKKYDFGSYKKVQEYINKFNDLRGNTFVKYANIIKSEDSTGDDLIECKNAKKFFNGTRIENCKYSFRGIDYKDSQDFMGGNAERVYNSQNTGWGSDYLFCSNAHRSNNLIYCESCYDSHDLFGCVGLRKKEFCVFNKQYTREEYEKLVAKIIEHMQKTGEWGEFFPLSISPHAYNETIASNYFQHDKKEILELGGKWQDNDFALEYEGVFYEPADDIIEYKDEGKQGELLSGILKCEVSGKPFKIMPQELAFYLEHGLPIPRKHFNVRFKERFEMRNPRKLYHRQCMCEETGHGHDGKCPNEFETTYAPDRPEKVYCEKCYRQSVI
ncbi:MAG: hypothetical protein NTZ65_00540 [Candidatus Berkelbacteria bacterium]|nr:hypothetical protein [Candidatus Berkelbacteria bacterium]